MFVFQLYAPLLNQITHNLQSQQQQKCTVMLLMLAIGICLCPLI